MTLSKDEALRRAARDVANRITDDHKGAWAGVMLQVDWMTGLIYDALLAVDREAQQARDREWLTALEGGTGGPAEITSAVQYARSQYEGAATAREREAYGNLHEVVDAACDHERLNGHPGARAMGAVIEYRDAIRARAIRENYPPDCACAAFVPPSPAPEPEQGQHGEIQSREEAGGQSYPTSPEGCTGSPLSARTNRREVATPLHAVPAVAPEEPARPVSPLPTWCYECGADPAEGQPHAANCEYYAGEPPEVAAPAVLPRGRGHGSPSTVEAPGGDAFSSAGPPGVSSQAAVEPCGVVLVPIPDHLADYRECFDPSSPEFGWDGQGHACFAIDACIASALRAVWAAGYRTLGCCCGHGQDAGGIITLDGAGLGPNHPCTLTHDRFKSIHDAALLGARGEDRTAEAFGRRFSLRPPEEVAPPIDVRRRSRESAAAYAQGFARGAEYALKHGLEAARLAAESMGERLAPAEDRREQAREAYWRAWEDHKGSWYGRGKAALAAYEKVR